MKREWARTVACATAQIVALATLAGWLLWGVAVPYRSMLIWAVPLLGAWAGRAMSEGAACIRERSRLRREVKLALRWEEIRP